MNNQRLIRIAISVLLILSAVLFWGWQQEQAQKPESLEKLTVAATQSALMVWLAQEKGFFKENGLDVTLIKEEGGHIAAKTVLEGGADIGTSSEFVLVSHSLNQTGLKTIGTVATADTIGLVARRDRGIQKPKDLVGKKIGVSRNSAGDYFLGTFATFNGISLEDIEMVNLSPTEIKEALSEGTIDAGITWDPYAYQIEQSLGTEALRFPGQSGQDFHFLLVSRSEWLESKPVALNRFIKAMVQTENFIKENKEASQKIVIDRFNYDSSYLKYVWDQQNFVVVLPQSLFTAMRDAARWKIDTGQTQQTQVPNFLKSVEMEPLKAVKPNGISIIH